MNKFSPENQKKSREELKERYQNEERTAFFTICLLIAFLLIFSISQFGILEYALEIIFNLYGDEQIFNIPIKTLISLLVTAFLPVASTIDESGILLKRLKILGIPSIWFLFSADICLTFIALFKFSSRSVSDSISVSQDIWIPPVTCFLISAVLSTVALFVTRTIVRLFRQWKEARTNQQIVNIDGMKENIKELENKLSNYKKYSDSIFELEKNFNPVKKLIVDCASQSQNIFEKLSSLDESVKEFNFPKPPQIDISSDSSNEVIEKPTYYWKDNGKLQYYVRQPSELSPAGSLLFEAIEKENLPEPIVDKYAPKEGLPECLVLYFRVHKVVVYCRDEKFKGEEQKWNTEDEINFQSKVSHEQSMKGIQSLVFTTEEIMNNPSKISAQIKDVIYSKVI
jgi:hypothetical protein